jgi:UDP-2,3-diacylglucosamine hydrolase
MTAPATSPLPPLGLIAGGGRLPILTAMGAKAAGRKVVCVGLADHYSPELRQYCDQFAEAGMIRISKWISLLRKWNAHEAVLIGKVEKSSAYTPGRLFRQLPDWRAARIWLIKCRHDRRSQKILTAVADELSNAGIELIDTTQYLPEHLATEGVLTRKQPSAAQLADIDFAWKMLKQIADMDIGQAIAVKDKDVIAVEAVEGTDAMIKRAGELCRAGGWILLKAPMNKHDMRFDVPTLGLKTIENVAAAKGACIVVQAGKAILADKPDFIAAADKAGLIVIGKP